MGLAFNTTGKWVSERFAKAQENGKMTAGEVVKLLKKKKINVTAKDLVGMFEKVNGFLPEWHHSGFYGKGRNKRMGRTYFFDEKQVIWFVENWGNFKQQYDDILIAEKKETQRKKRLKRYGFYWVWESDYNGRYGKKRNFKVLKFWKGSLYEMEQMSNFTQLTKREYDRLKSLEGKKYFGWDEPELDDLKSLI